VATSTYGTPYVQGSDLVSAYPTVSSSLATRVDEVSYRGNGLNAQTGTTYTLVVGDAGKTITLSNASPVAVTLPQDSTADLPDGAVVTFYNLGAGTVTISQGTGATLNGGSITLAQYEVTSVIKLSANTYGKADGAGVGGLTLCTPTSIANAGGTATLANGTVSFSGALTSVSLNGVFTATYDNYRIIVNTLPSANADGTFRLRAAGTDNSTASSYIAQRLTASSTTLTGARTTADSWGIYQHNTTRYNQHTMEIARPFVVGTTAIQNLTTSSDTGAYLANYVGTHNQSVSYDGFTLFAGGAANMEGTLTVYGYKK